MAARLSPHQAAALARLRALAAHQPGGWVRSTRLGSPGAQKHLVEKGYAEHGITASDGQPNPPVIVTDGPCDLRRPAKDCRVRPLGRPR